MEDFDRIRQRRSAMRNLLFWILAAVVFVYLWTSAGPFT